MDKKLRDKPPAGNSYEAFCKRLDWVEEKSGIALDPEEKRWGSELRGIIENPIGFNKIPLAIAGPILIDGVYAKGEFIIPLCTVEATLSMSLNRGAYFTKLSGGIKTIHIKQAISRSPIFYLSNLREAQKFVSWIQAHDEEVRQAAESTTKYGKLQSIEPHYLGSNVILDFIYTTGEAAGQNMTTFSTSAACHWIIKNFPRERPLEYLIESNFNGDKNSSARSLLLGRGHSVVAEGIIEKKILERLLGEGAGEKLVHSCKIGAASSMLAGVLTYNLHTVNALSAIYLACGQDAACVVENSLNTFYTEVTPEGDFKFSLNMPSITVGTVGGGTQLEDQKRNLEILKCTGPDSSKKFAEIIAAACLCIELSLGIAVTFHQFVKAHYKYSRVQ